MRIGLIADTHCDGDAAALPAEIFAAFRGVDLLLHLGDIISLATLDRLQAVAPVRAIRGYPDPCEEGDRLVDSPRVVTVGGARIAMAHDLGWPGPRIDAGQTLSFPETHYGSVTDLLRVKFGGPVDVVAFGDTHEELVEWHEGVLFVNPGSPTYPGIRHRIGSLGTVGLLTVNDHGPPRAEIVDLARLRASSGG